MDEIYVPEDKRTTAWYIFFKKFRCQLPNIDTYSKDYVRNFGMPSSGDLAIDRQLANEIVDRLLSIAEIAEYHSSGTNIRVVHYEDTKEIYERITDHLNFWKKEMEDSYHPVTVPMEDLIKLDKLAAAVHPHAKYQFTTEIVESIMSRKMSNMMRVSRRNIMGAAPTTAPAGEEAKPVDNTHQHVSMAELFAEQSNAKVKVNKWG